jgi:hypothetical protein
VCAKCMKDCQAGIIEDFQCAIPTGKEQFVARPGEPYMIGLDCLLVLRHFGIRGTGYTEDGIVLNRKWLLAIEPCDTRKTSAYFCSNHKFRAVWSPA